MLGEIYNMDKYITKTLNETSLREELKETLETYLKQYKKLYDKGTKTGGIVASYFETDLNEHSAFEFNTKNVPPGCIIEIISDGNSEGIEIGDKYLVVRSTENYLRLAHEEGNDISMKKLGIGSVVLGDLIFEVIREEL